MHGLILIPWGHGAAPLILFEVIGIPDFVSNGLSLSASGGDYEKAVGVSVLLSLIGHVLLVAGLFFKLSIRKLNFILVGLVSLAISSLNILFHSFDFWVIFFFSLPFWAATVWLAIVCARNRKVFRSISH